MPVTQVEKNAESLSLTVTSEFDASVERVWRLWADPRQLERWWGPPTYPATVVVHDLAPGGRVAYFMTGPEGDRHHGWWKIVSVNPPRGLRFIDGFADATGAENPELPTMTATVAIDPLDGGRTRMTISSQFASLAHMEQLAAMGMVEGITAAINQIDAFIAD